MITTIPKHLMPDLNRHGRRLEARLYRTQIQTHRKWRAEENRKQINERAVLGLKIRLEAIRNKKTKHG